MLQYHNCRSCFVIRFHLILLINSQRSKKFSWNFFHPKPNKHGHPPPRCHVAFLKKSRHGLAERPLVHAYCSYDERGVNCCPDSHTHAWVTVRRASNPSGSFLPPFTIVPCAELEPSTRPHRTYAPYSITALRASSCIAVAQARNSPCSAVGLLL